MMSDEVVEILLGKNHLINRLQVVRTLGMYWLLLNHPPIVD